MLITYLLLLQFIFIFCCEAADLSVFYMPDEVSLLETMLCKPPDWF